MEPFELSLAESAKKIKSRELSSYELVESCLNRIASVDDKISAFLQVQKEVALKTAKEADQKIKSGKLNSPLAGIPFALKDNLQALGTKTTAGSKILAEYKSAYDATAVKKLRNGGAVFLGKTNLDEFGMGSSTENSAFGKTKNPWNLKKVPGGSSGGSAAAVAAGECMAALGSDTGGSVRQPSSFCGVVGLKPTYGRVSRYGLVALASSFDQIGPIAKTVEDCALVFNAIAGFDPHDSTTVKEKVPDYLKDLKKGIKGLKVGVPREYFIEGIDKNIKKTVKEAIKQLEMLGAKIQEVSLPNVEYALAAYYVILPAEASANLARYDGVRYGYSVMEKKQISDLFSVYALSRAKGFGPEVKRRIMIGAYCLSSGYYDAYYKKAQQVRILVENDFQEAFKKVDVLAAPTTPTTAFNAGEKISDPLSMYLSDIYTVSANIAGVPAVSVPCGFVDGMPVGLQLTSRPFEEALLLKTAYSYEQATPWHAKKPEITGK